MNDIEKKRIAIKERGNIEYELAILTYIFTLEEKVKELTVERDSETRWAKEYFNRWEQAESRIIKELEKGILNEK